MLSPKSRSNLFVASVMLSCMNFQIGYAQQAHALFSDEKQITEMYGQITEGRNVLPKTVLDAFIASQEASPIKIFPESPELTYQLVNRSMPASLRGEAGITTIRQQTALISGALTQDEIANWYAQTVYLGNECYGVRDAAYAYFFSELDDLSLSKVALLATLPRRPSFYTNNANQSKTIEDRNLILDRMLLNGTISAVDANAAKLEGVAWRHPLRHCQQK